MAEIIDDVLTLTRDRDAELEYERLELDSIVEGCWENVDTETATLEISTGMPIQADPIRLRHVFENLFRNAIEHADAEVTESRSVHFPIRGGGFYVEDTGPGIPRENRDTVFER